LWVGKEKADAIFQRGAEIAYTEEDYESIRSIEHLLYIAADSGEIKTYVMHEWEGRWLFNEVPVKDIMAKPFFSTKIEVTNPFNFHIPPLRGPYPTPSPAERLHTYFDYSNEVVAKFPFLKEEPGSVVKDNRVAVDVSRALWAGLTPDVAFKNLKNKDFAEVIIAFILCKKMKCKKIKLGEMLYHDPKDKNSEKETSTYLRKVDKLLTDCDNSYILSFPE
jgi:hypothetical protein